MPIMLHAKQGACQDFLEKGSVLICVAAKNHTKPTLNKKTPLLKNKEGSFSELNILMPK